MSNPANFRFQALGSWISYNDPTYIQRLADDELYRKLTQGELCYVLNSRQMGKSTLRECISKRLQIDGVVCGIVDLQSIAVSATEEAWYTGIVEQLVKGLPRLESLNWRSWWDEQSPLSHVQRWGIFLEKIVLGEYEQNVVIFIDEIDSVLSLQFPSDDFFTQIRYCQGNSRSDNSPFKRLTFCILGVSTPSDLIADNERTPFNIGQAVELTGFTFQEAEHLAEGFNGIAENPKAVLQEILNWTGGQPFLTQRVCGIVQSYKTQILEGQEKHHIEKLVQKNVVERWESQDEPVHLRTIYNRIFKNKQQDKQRVSRLLEIYQKILLQGQVPTDGSHEQSELLLSGLVVKQKESIKVYNPIYKKIFNEQWVREELSKFCPYEEAMNAWLLSHCTEDSRLLRGKALKDALAWAKDKQLEKKDLQFLEKSQITVDNSIKQILELLSKAEGSDIADTLREFLPDLKRLADRPVDVIREIVSWASPDQFLTKQLCDLIKSESSNSEDVSIPEGEEAARVEELVQTYLVQNWQEQVAGKHLGVLHDAIVGDIRCVELLELYQRILRKEEVISNDPELEALLGRLIKNQEGKLQVANLTYENVFSQAWIDQELERAKNRRIIYNRYKVIRDLQKEEFIQTYLAEDRGEEVVVKQLTPVSTAAATLRETKIAFDNRYRDLKNISDVPGVPELVTSFEELQTYYFVQKFIDGSSLEEEIKSKSKWDELEVVDLLIEILEILESVHRWKIAHQNLKPSNIVRQKQDQKIALIDFDFLKQIVISTASPEQKRRFQQPRMSAYVPPEDTGGWTDFVLDVYAAGMIGIQLITGTSPQDLNIDKNTGEYLWHIFPIQIKPELAQILSKMVCHNVEGRYKECSEVINDFNALKAEYSETVHVDQVVSYPWFKSKGAIAAGIGSLLIISSMGYGWFRDNQSNQRLTVQNNNLLSMQNNQTQKIEPLEKQCSSPLTSSKNDGKVDVETIALANIIAYACGAGGDSSATLNRAKALLVLSKGALQMGQREDKQKFLTEAQAVLSKSKTDDPQVKFYLGLVEQLLGDKNYKDTYNEAVTLYLKDKNIPKGENYIILAWLGDFLDGSNFKTSDNLYQKSVDAITDETDKRYKGNVLYNRLVLKNRPDIRAQRTQLMSDVFNVDSSNKRIQDYSDSCAGSNQLKSNPSRCNELSQPLPIYACKDYPALAVLEDGKDKESKLCDSGKATQNQGNATSP